MAPFAASDVLRLQWLLTATDVQRKLALFFRATKAGFNPDQPRVPAGNPDGGQWTDAGGSGGSEATDISAAKRQSGDRPPHIPENKPSTAKERNRISKDVARWLVKVGKKLGAIGKIGSWIYEAGAIIVAYQDPPSLEELQDRASTPEPGYDIHHVVEQTSAAQDGFPRSLIDAPENRVLIPRMKHWEITGWYTAKNERFGGLSPRDYLRGADWEERYWVGLEALIEHGVLEP